MLVLREISRRFNEYFWPFLGAVILIYFYYHLIQGDHGLLAWKSLTKKLESDTKVLEETESIRKGLERDVQLLNPKTLDLDMLDERVRTMLNYHQQDDVLVLGK